MSKRIIRRGEVLSRTGMSKSDLYARIANGKFPRQVQLGERIVGWVEDEVDAWIDAKIVGRDQRLSVVAATTGGV